MDPIKNNLTHCRNLFICTFAVFLFGNLASGQSMPEERQGRESQEARAEESLVSLSADTLSEILRHEPGLLLQVKKMLVRKAYEQGRLLDPEDLTDDTLYRLLRDDNSIRILATQEVEKRGYVRAKPTRRELDQEKIERVEGTKVASANEPPQTQEEKYWAEHEELPSRQDATVPGQPSQQPAAAPGAPATPIPPDIQRQLNMAGVSPQDLNSYRNSGSLREQNPYDTQQDSGSLPRISPDALPGLLSTSMGGDSAQRLGSDDSGSLSGSIPSSLTSGLSLGGGDLSQLAALSALSSGAQSGGGSSLSVDQNNANNPQMARLDTRYRPMPTAIPEDDHPVIRHRPNPYADIPSLYDLYAQVSKHSPVLTRFGANIFENGTGNFDELPMDMPVGPDYVLGPGDRVSIELWGSVSQHLQRVVDRSGRLALPEAGAIQVTGRTLGDVQQLVQGVLRTEYRDVQADISLARLRTVRVYVVGDVIRPGAYDVSSLSTPLNALYLAGGPTSQGSLRLLRHYRGQQLIEELDVYDLLLHGVRSGVQRLQAGDTILIPPLGAEVTIEGMVRRPAIYELGHENGLAQVLELAGGVLNSGTLRHIEVERVVAHESRTMLRLDLPENNNQESANQAIEDFKIQDGDKIRISPILAYSEKTVYLDGHVFHPGKYAYRDGMRVSDLIKSYNDLLPEPSNQHAEIIRLNPPDYTPTVIAFNLSDALAEKDKGKEQDIVLKSFDTVRIFGRYDFEDPPLVSVTGEVRDPGEHVTNGVTRLRDAVYLAGGVTRDALLTDAQIFRRTPDGKLKVLSVNLERALTGNDADNIPLEPKDRIFIHRNLSKFDPPVVKVEGEVARPGKYPLGEDMTAAQLVRLAGGFKRGAFTEAADLTRYTTDNGKQILGEHVIVPIARALANEPDTDVRLHDGDVLTVRQLAGWNDVGSLITVKGEVMHPGDYGIQEGERLSTVLARAGGLRSDAYPYGAILERKQVRELEEKNRAELIQQVQSQQTQFRLIPDTGDIDDKVAKDALIQQWRSTLDHLKDTPPTGRQVIHISGDVKKWANTAADLEVRAGDTLFIPKRPNSVIVNGQVYNPTAITYRPGKSAGWYLREAGGPTNMANKKAVIIVRADGSVAGHNGGLFTGDALSAELRPGDLVFVPEKALGGGVNWRNLTLTAQLASSVAIAASVAHSF